MEISHRKNKYGNVDQTQNDRAEKELSVDTNISIVRALCDVKLDFS